MKPALLAVLVLVCAGPAAIGFGQTPKYEVASIKPSSPNQQNRTVIDRTELKGYFDFTLAWTSAALASTSVAGADRGPSIFTAVQDQLGLRLESTRGPVQVLIIDHIERPTAK